MLQGNTGISVFKPACCHSSCYQDSTRYLLFDPTNCHWTVAVEVVPLTISFSPSRLHHAMSIEVIPFAPCLEPAIYHCTVFFVEIPNTFFLSQPIVTQSFLSLWCWVEGATSGMGSLDWAGLSGSAGFTWICCFWFFSFCFGFCSIWLDFSLDL